MREVLKDLASLGKTILISSHILPELRELCTHVGIVADGHLIREGPLAAVLFASTQPAYELRATDLEAATQALAGVPGVGAIERTPDGLRFHCEGGPEGAATALSSVVAAGVAVYRFAEAERDLETAY